MLDLEHQAIVIRQRALNEQEYEHRERVLKLERQYALTEIVVEPTRSFPESKDVDSPGEAVVNSGQGLTESGDTGPSNHKPQDRLSKAGSKVELFMNLAKRAAERGADKRRGFLEPSSPHPRGNSH